MKVNDTFETKGFHVTDTFVKIFADITADMNPLHLDEEYAKTTRFGQRIAHGMLTAGFISATIAKHFPGAVYVRQSLHFSNSVYINDVVNVIFRINDINDTYITLNTTAYVEDKIVVFGEAKILYEVTSSN